MNKEMNERYLKMVSVLHFNVLSPPVLLEMVCNTTIDKYNFYILSIYCINIYEYTYKL